MQGDHHTLAGVRVTCFFKTGAREACLGFSGDAVTLLAHAICHTGVGRLTGESIHRSELNTALYRVAEIHSAGVVITAIDGRGLADACGADSGLSAAVSTPAGRCVWEWGLNASLARDAADGQAWARVCAFCGTFAKTIAIVAQPAIEA